VKIRTVSLVLLMSLHGGATVADTVIGEMPDTLPASGFGGYSGLMAGFVVGGPVGAAIGAGAGWLAGDTVQKSAGLSGRAYRVRRDDGSEVTVRSPNRTWSSGDRVRIVERRLVAARDAADSDAALSAHLR
jgi:outer membrane lipoprotein SlyB